MATKQAPGIGRDPIPFPFNAFATTTVSLKVALALGANDVLELAGLPPQAILTDVRIETKDIPEDVTFGLGIMSGNFNDTTNDRTVGTELLAAAARNADLTAPVSALDAVDVGEVVQSIGIDFSGAVTGGTVFLLVSYRAA